MGRRHREGANEQTFYIVTERGAFRVLASKNHAVSLGQTQAQRLAERRRNMTTVRVRLSEIVTTEEAERWIYAPNPVFDNARPVDLVRQGKITEVLQVITTVAEGIHV